MELYDNSDRLIPKESVQYKQIEKLILDKQLGYNPSVRNHYFRFLDSWMRDDIFDYMTDNKK